MRMRLKQNWAPSNPWISNCKVAISVRHVSGVFLVRVGIPMCRSRFLYVKKYMYIYVYIWYIYVYTCAWTDWKTSSKKVYRYHARSFSFFEGTWRHRESSNPQWLTIPMCLVRSPVGLRSFWVGGKIIPNDESLMGMYIHSAFKKLATKGLSTVQVSSGWSTLRLKSLRGKDSFCKASYRYRNTRNTNRTNCTTTRYSICDFTWLLKGSRI